MAAMSGAGSKRLISIREACSLTSLSRTSIWLKVKSKAFPQPVRLGADGGRKAFVAAEVESWIDQQIAARDKEAA
jgi:prophage regulatory protein